MSAVTFVQDYLQLHFDGPSISAYVWPRIIEGAHSITRDTPGYRDALCGLIGNTVLSAHHQAGESLIIEFANGVALDISLKEADREGPEAAMFRDVSGTAWNVW